MTIVGLGDKVRDTVTGVTGIAFAKTEYLQGCNRVAIQEPQPRLNRERNPDRRSS